MHTRLFFAFHFAFLISLASAAGAQQAKPFEPVSGQAGKDVVWVPSPPDMVNKLMELGQVTSKDFVMDLGSGDGRNVIAAAKLGAQALGVEYNPDMVELSRRLAREAGVADKAQFVQADMYEYDISKATVMALFLLPVNMNRLAPKFFNLAPGSRIVANTFGIEGWEPDVRVTLPPTSECESWCEALLWLVPAKIAGTWTMANGAMTLTQEYQAVQGTVTIAGQPQTVVMGRLKGEEITFTAGGLTYQGIAKGNTITGTVTTPNGALPWTATRK
ncbi:MAG: class I SAM-dependent methyltransferase [Cyanobacteria bacterium]|nr:class I SAM-dependent methyltransferase [Cyanobacteriota bacterium]